MTSWEVCVALSVRLSCVSPFGPLRYPHPEFGCSQHPSEGGQGGAAQTVESDGVPHRPQAPDVNKKAELRPWLTTET